MNGIVNLTLGYADRQDLEVTSRIDLFMRVVEARINRVLGDASVIIDNDDLDHLRINSDSLIPVLVNAIKELTTRLEALEGKL